MAGWPTVDVVGDPKDDAADRPAAMEGLDPVVARLEAERDREDPEDGSQDEIEAAWRAETQRRADDIDAGREELVDADEHYVRLRAELEDAGYAEMAASITPEEMAERRAIARSRRARRAAIEAAEEDQS